MSYISIPSYLYALWALALLAVAGLWALGILQIVRHFRNGLSTRRELASMAVAVSLAAGLALAAMDVAFQEGGIRATVTESAGEVLMEPRCESEAYAVTFSFGAQPSPHLLEECRAGSRPEVR